MFNQTNKKKERAIFLGHHLCSEFARSEKNILNCVCDSTRVSVSDYRMNPNLKKSCKLDIPKFCAAVLSTQKNDEHLEGKVINCLKIKYRQNVRQPEDDIKAEEVKINENDTG